MSAPPTLPAPLYMGAVNAWECDEGGHLNVRFQAERAFTGLAMLAAALDMPRASTLSAGATMLTLDLHVRFLKEARAGEALTMHGGVLECSESDAAFCLDMRHANGAPASAFRLRAVHVEPRTLKVFPWATRTRAAAARLACAAPDHAAPRSIDITRSPGDPNLTLALELGAPQIGAHVVSPDQCDVFGRLRAEHFLGRVSDSVSHLMAPWRRAVAQESAGAQAVNAAGAVVEARIVYRRWPRAGDLIVVHSGIVEVGEKALRLVHWLLDPITGAAWASVEAVALTFDTATRKTISPSEALRETLKKTVIAGLTL